MRRSRAAGWARLCGGLALPVLAVGVIGTRIGLVPDVAIEPVLVAGFLLGLLALGLACYSLADIWKSGAEGTWVALAGIVYASPVLIVLGLIVTAAFLYPRLNDIATDVDDPPRFTAEGAPRATPDAARARLQRDAYPDIASHVYPLPIGEVYLAARQIVDKRHWTVTRDIHPSELPGDSTGPATSEVAEDDELVQALARKSVMTQSRRGSASRAPPAPPARALPGPVSDDAAMLTELSAASAPDDEAMLEVLAPTPVFGFTDDVVVRLRTVFDGTQVDLRSASRVGVHDLGENARRIRSFLAELDSVLQPDSESPSSGIFGL